MIATEVAGQNIDDVGQPPIRDLHHQPGEEIDHVHQSQGEIGHVRQSQEEIVRDHQLREEIGQSRQFEDEIALTDHKDGDQRHQRNAGEADQTENGSMYEHGEEILLRPNLDHRPQSDGGDQLIDGLLTLQVGMTEITEMVERMGGAMIIGEMVVIMKEEMIEGHRRILGRRMLKTEKQSDNGSWQPCNKMPRS